VKPLVVILFVAAYGFFTATAMGEPLFDDGPTAQEQSDAAFAAQAKSIFGEALSGLSLSMELESLKGGDCGRVLGLEEEAFNGNGQSQYILGILANEGWCVAKNKAQAARWMQQAAQNGVREAQSDLGLMYLNGSGVQQSTADAVSWFERAFDGGDLEAARKLFLIYRGGNGIPKDLALAETWIKRAIDGGNDDAAAQLGFHYLQDKTPEGARKAVRVALPAAERGHTASQVVMGLALTGDLEGPQENLIEGYKWFNIASAATDQKQAADVAREMRDGLEEYLLPKEKAEAQRRSSVFKPVVRKTASVAERSAATPLPGIGDEQGRLSEAEARVRLKELGIAASKDVFFQAVKTDNLGVVKLFLDAGAGLETEWGNGRMTPLFHAVEYGAFRVFDHLLAQGAEVNVYASDGATPLVRAISHERPKMIWALLAHGASARQLTEYQGGTTALEYALIGEPDLKLVRALLAQGGSPNELLSMGVTPLMRAACMGSEVFEVLLLAGGNVNAADRFGNTVVDHSVACGQVNKNNLQMALASGGQVSDMALLAAVYEGDVKVVGMLLDGGGSPQARYRIPSGSVPFTFQGRARDIVMNGGSLLMMAVERGHASVTKLLVQRGATVDTKAKIEGQLMTALDLARKTQSALLISILSNGGLETGGVAPVGK